MLHVRVDIGHIMYSASARELLTHSLSLIRVQYNGRYWVFGQLTTEVQETARFSGYMKFVGCICAAVSWKLAVVNTSVQVRPDHHKLARSSPLMLAVACMRVDPSQCCALLPRAATGPPGSSCVAGLRTPRQTLGARTRRSNWQAVATEPHGPPPRRSMGGTAVRPVLLWARYARSAPITGEDTGVGFHATDSGYDGLVVCRFECCYVCAASTDRSRLTFGDRPARSRARRCF